MNTIIAEKELAHHERFYQKRRGKVNLVWRVAEEVLFKQYLQNAAGKRIVELGCGDGTGIKYLKESCGMRNFDYTGFDVSPTAIEQANHIFPYGVFDLFDCTKGLPFRTDRVDFIISFGVLHHIHPEAESVIAECLRVLKPNGLLLLREPTDAMKQGDGDSPYEFGFKPPDMMETVLRYNGKIVDFVTFDHRVTTPLRVICKLINAPSLYRLEREIELGIDRSLGRYGITTGLDFAMVVKKIE